MKEHRSTTGVKGLRCIRVSLPELNHNAGITAALAFAAAWKLRVVSDGFMIKRELKFNAFWALVSVAAIVAFNYTDVFDVGATFSALMLNYCTLTSKVLASYTYNRPSWLRFRRQVRGGLVCGLLYVAFHSQDHNVLQSPLLDDSYVGPQPECIVKNFGFTWLAISRGSEIVLNKQKSLSLSLSDCRNRQ